MGLRIKQARDTPEHACETPSERPLAVEQGIDGESAAARVQGIRNPFEKASFWGVKQFSRAVHGPCGWRCQRQQRESGGACKRCNTGWPIERLAAATQSTGEMHRPDGEMSKRSLALDRILCRVRPPAATVDVVARAARRRMFTGRTRTPTSTLHRDGINTSQVRQVLRRSDGSAPLRRARPSAERPPLMSRWQRPSCFV